MGIMEMKVNHLEKPIGYALDNLLFSWKVDGDSWQLKGSRIIISEDERFDSILYDTGFKREMDGIGYQVDLSLKSRTRYFWKVIVQIDDQQHIENSSFFETGKMNEPWIGQWITASFAESPYICKEFEVDDLTDATLYIAFRGIGEVYINGEKVSKDFLNPGYSSYDLWEQTHTIKVTDYIHKGKNVLGVMLGDGWYRGRLGYDGVYMNNYGSLLMILGELYIKKTNGDNQIIKTDESFVCHKSPITESNIYDGENFDDRMNIINWYHVSCKRENWDSVKVCEGSMVGIQDRLYLPIRKHEVFKPKILNSPKGETILDFGQNMAGWVEGDILLKKDEVMKLSYGEILQQDCFYNENLRTAKAIYKFTSNGKSAYFRPHFTYYGFRYVKVEGNVSHEQLENFRAYALYSNMNEISNITTGNNLVNQLISNVKWGQKSNFLDTPTDCPQRDERFGWTGDTQIFSATASYNMDTAAFYSKHLKDIRLEQQQLDGGIPFVVPYLKTVGPDSGQRRHSSCGWGDIATVLPWNMYLFYGDKVILETYYPMMKEWVDYIKKIDDENGSMRLWQTGFHFADWLALDNYKNPESPMGGTDAYYVASAWYAYSASLVCKAAEVLDEIEDTKYYHKLSSEIKKAIQDEYFSKNGRCVISTQTAKVMALHMELVPKKYRERIAKDLVSQLKENNMKLETGFSGTPFLLKVLSEMNYTDEAYEIFLNEDNPGWLYEVKMGATTVWERWDSVMPDYTMNPKGMNSLNHYAYGAVMEWFYRYACGIKIREDAPGFTKVLIEPQPNRKLGWLNCSLNTHAGIYKVSWRIDETEVNYDIQIPCGREAYLKLPGENAIRLLAGTYTYKRSEKYVK